MMLYWLPVWLLRLLAGPRQFDAAWENAERRADIHGKAAFTLPTILGGEVQIGLERND
jgi:hypothetical protein